MNYRLNFLHHILFFLIFLTTSCSFIFAQEKESGISTRLPHGVPPEITFWGMNDFHFAPNGFKPIIDIFADHSPFSLLNTTLRLQDHPLSDVSVHDHLLALVRYARERNLKPTLDLCLRLDRKPFQNAYPDELQEMVKLAEIRLSPDSVVQCTVEPEIPGDHMTFNDTKYIPTAGRLLRVYAYARDGGKILPGSIRDITGECRVISAGAGGVRVALPPHKKSERTTACVMACFTHLSPDVFAPHLLEYQRELIRQYSDLPLAGAFKDEWGFPASSGRVLTEHRAFWYSGRYAEAYSRSTGGQDLAEDILLMAYPQRGRRIERQRAINHFMRLNLERNIEIEEDFYRAVK